MVKTAEMQQPVESEILDILNSAQTEVHTEQVAERLGMARHTAAKYLEVLKAKGRVSCRKVGNAKLWRTLSDVTIRTLCSGDVTTLLQIEKRIEQRQGFEAGERLSNLAEAARHRIEQRQPCLVALVNGQLVGFVLGDVRSWEFGSGERTGWIDVIGIDPEFWDMGIGRRLGEALLAQFKERGAVRVRTLVDSYSGELIAFFRTLGFQILNMLPLEKRLMESTNVLEPASGHHLRGGRDDGPSD